MGIQITTQDYVAYLLRACKKIEENKDYITQLDSKTGDGDHWVNLNMGFQKVASLAAELEAMTVSDMLKKVGMTMMSAVGGSSGVLYGSAYIAAAKAVKEVPVLDENSLLIVLESMLQAIMDRGQAKPGFKTMVDSLYEAVEAYKKALNGGGNVAGAIAAMKKGAQDGMERTKDMEAVKGRASYQTEKGVGDLDPGAVTMCMQLECLADYILEMK